MVLNPVSDNGVEHIRAPGGMQYLKASPLLILGDFKVTQWLAALPAPPAVSGATPELGAHKLQT